MKPDKVLVVEYDNAIRKELVAVLSDAGYDVSADYRGGMKAVVAFGPDVVVLGADPPKIDCCDLLSQIKASENTQSIRVVMLSPGGSGERTRGLDLGADDVLSLPFDPHELLSRVRLQLRSKRIADESRERLRAAEDSRNVNQQVIAAVNEERRTLRVGGLATVIVLIAAGLIALLFFRRTHEENTRVYAAITRLQGGMRGQQQLMERSRRALEDRERESSAASDAQKLQLQQKIRELKSQIASSKAEDTSALHNQLTAIEGRIHKLEAEGKVAQTIIQSYEPSVCLIRVVLAFRDRTSGLRLHYAGLTSKGEPTL